MGIDSKSCILEQGFYIELLSFSDLIGTREHFPESVVVLCRLFPTPTATIVIHEAIGGPYKWPKKKWVADIITPY